VLHLPATVLLLSWRRGPEAVPGAARLICPLPHRGFEAAPEGFLPQAGWLTCKGKLLRTFVTLPVPVSVPEFDCIFIII
jgi:hypothetical protein